MYAVLMTALVSVDAQTQSFCFLQRMRNTRSVCSSSCSSCGCSGYVTYSSCYGCGGCWTHSVPSCSYVVCSGCSASVCCGAWSPCSGCFVSTPVSCGCSMPFATSHVMVQPSTVVYGTVNETVVPSATPTATPSDPTLTPSTDAEKNAVREALRFIREKKALPNNSLPPPIPGINPKLEVPPPPPPGLSAQAKVTIRVPEAAKLWIDDVACPLEGEVRSFNVPNLQSGVDYAYTVRIEVERDGKMTTEERQVQFAAGKNVEIDFGANASQTARR